MSFLYVHLPNNPWDVRLSNFEHARRRDFGRWGGHIEFDIALRQLVDTFTSKRIGPRGVLPDKCGCSSAFINLEDLWHDCNRPDLPETRT
jgi:hypothetical protein